MRKIHTAEQLNEFLNSEISWRKRELSIFKLLLKGDAKSGATTNCLCRSGTTLLYAHWEGFIKAAAEGYLRFVASQELNYESLSNNFLAISIKARLNETLEAKKIERYGSVVDFFRTQLATRSRIPWDSTVRTRSNLSSEVLEEITSTLGLDFSLYETKRKLIDEKLVNKRNNIAHGQYLDLDESEYSALQEEVIGLMEIFRNQIDNSAALRTYLHA
jgi:hypothetical protein